MKKFLTISVVAIALFATALTLPPLRSSFTLAWDYGNVSDTNLVFIIRGTTNLSNTDIRTWPVVGVTGYTNRSITLSNMIPAEMYFAASASNLWGESFFSNQAVLPAPPIYGTNLVIQ